MNDIYTILFANDCWIDLDTGNLQVLDSGTNWPKEKVLLNPNTTLIAITTKEAEELRQIKIIKRRIKKVQERNETP